MAEKEWVERLHCAELYFLHTKIYFEAFNVPDRTHNVSPWVGTKNMYGKKNYKVFVAVAPKFSEYLQTPLG